jgi:endonuclease/exonuclease/phosphatase (EEP) superfamily protein YafD
VVDKILRVLSANVYNGRAAIGSLRRVLEHERAAVAAFQELDPAQARIVEQLYPYGCLDPRRDHHGMGIAATHPVEVDRFDMEHRDGWRGMLRAGDWPQLDRDVEVLNVHIQNPLMHPIRQTARNRKGQVDGILEYVATKRMARVIVGDMNSSPAWRSYKRLAAQLQDAAVAAGTASSTWAYFSWMPRMLRIDHAFIEGLVAVSTHTAKIRRSDHSALIVDLYAE